MGRSKKSGSARGKSQPQGSGGLSWRGAMVVCAIVVGVVIVMAALGMFQFMGG